MTFVATASPEDITALGNPPGETLEARVTRWAFNLFPAFFFTGAKITYFDGKFRELHVRIPLTWRTRNYVGTMFGGSMFAALDPVYMVMLIRRLGGNYVVWDKAGTIKFFKPGRAPLSARFYLSEALVFDIRSEADRTGRAERTFTIQLVDDKGMIHAVVEKEIVVKKK